MEKRILHLRLNFDYCSLKLPPVISYGFMKHCPPLLLNSLRIKKLSQRVFIDCQHSHWNYTPLHFLFPFIRRELSWLNMSLMSIFSMSLEAGLGTLSLALAPWILNFMHLSGGILGGVCHGISILLRGGHDYLTVSLHL